VRKFTEQEREKLKSLISNYIELRNLSFGENHSQAITQGRQKAKAIKELLSKNNIDPSWMGVISKKSSEDEIISKLFKEHPEVKSDKNKEICLLYIKIKKMSKDVDARKEKTKSSILKKIAKIDPMLSAYVLYKVKVFQAQKVLEKSLVNETLDSLEQRYKEILKDFDL
jgi:hypothetical protein